MAITQLKLTTQRQVNKLINNIQIEQQYTGNVPIYSINFTINTQINNIYI